MIEENHYQPLPPSHTFSYQYDDASSILITPDILTIGNTSLLHVPILELLVRNFSLEIKKKPQGYLKLFIYVLVSNPGSSWRTFYSNISWTSGLDVDILYILAGVTRIELASAVLETVALPLCYTPMLRLVIIT